MRDLREYRLQLAARAPDTPVTGADPGRRVEATVVGGALVGVEVDPSWRSTASDEELERAITAAVGAALAEFAAVPLRALDGCGDLREVLHRAGSQLAGLGRQR